MEKALIHYNNAYYFPNGRVRGWVCKTNLPSSTGFRGFGGPQAMFAAENMIRNVAATLNKPYTEIIEINLKKEGDLSHFSQIYENCNIRG